VGVTGAKDRAVPLSGVYRKRSLNRRPRGRDRKLLTRLDTSIGRWDRLPSAKFCETVYYDFGGYSLEANAIAACSIGASG
jgi:hypothetical protein